MFRCEFEHVIEVSVVVSVYRQAFKSSICSTELTCADPAPPDRRQDDMPDLEVEQFGYSTAIFDDEPECFVSDRVVFIIDVPNG